MYFYISNELGMCCWTYLISHCMFIRLWTIRFSVGKVSFAERRYSKLR